MRRDGVVLVQRMWFNEASSSTWYLVPGLLALVMTLIGAFLTSLLIAREWERGTLEALFVTPVRPLELVLAKLAPYLVHRRDRPRRCACSRRDFLFHVPMRGSLAAIDRSSLLYLVGVAVARACSSPARRATSSRRASSRCSPASCRR